MLPILPISVWKFMILSAFAETLVLTESIANAQGMYGGNAGGPVGRGMNTAIPLPVTTPGYGGRVQPGRMVHPSASPYLFQSGRSNDVIHTGARTTASFPVGGVVEVPADSVQQFGIRQTQFSPLGNCETCLSSSCGGCSTGACGSLGDLMPFQWVQAVGGDEYGVNQSWYSQFGFFAPVVILPDETGLSFIQANGTYADGNVYGANVGLVTRYQDLASYWFFGSGLWYDYETGPDQDLHQPGSSIAIHRGACQ
jgi:hypothetical protein